MIALFMLIAVIFAVLVFRLAVGMDWHWGFAACLAAVPLGATFFMGAFGLIGSAMFVAAMYKASAAM